ncbi:MAG TPA: YihY/virulence factor BrkB family protein [Candidatus Acidoferrales bacterium]|nr:YihY/virulence factor BrkB family protein [Candidatus Acidoferrales bacterium]
MKQIAPREWLNRMESLDPSRLSLSRRIALLTLRIALAVGRDLTQGPLRLWAMSLVYTTLLSLVPLLALAFSVLKAFGAHNVAEPLIAEVLAPLGPQGVELTRTIIGFVENMKVGVLGSVGLGFLLYTVVSLIQKVEQAFNQIWRVSEARSLARSFKDYLIVVLLAPVLYLVATGLFASIMGAEIVRGLSDWQPFGLALFLLARLAPLVLITAIFTLIYLFLPNTRVRWHAALTGALATALAWLVGGRAFAFFVAGSTNYDAIYSGFAILILLLIWLNVIWTILLTGAQIAFYVQYPAATGPIDTNVAERAAPEYRALGLLLAVAVRHVHGLAPATLESLAREMGVPASVLGFAVDDLVERDLLVRSNEDPPRLVLARAPEQISLQTVFSAPAQTLSGHWPVPLRQLEQELAQCREHVLGERTLAELLPADSASNPQAAAPAQP